MKILPKIQSKYRFPLNKDFASYKNNLKSHCKGDYIFQIDVDEVPNEYLLDNLHEILEAS